MDDSFQYAFVEKTLENLMQNELHVEALLDCDRAVTGPECQAMKSTMYRSAESVRYVHFVSVMI